MSYAAAIHDLNALAPELFTHPGRPRRKFSLEEFRVLLAGLGNPQERFPAVLIAGTNGKGSTAATLAAILQASGFRTGLYTSPHLERPNERIRIHDAEIDDDAFARHYFAVRAAAERLVAAGTLAQPPSFFETLTAMAFLAFAEQQIEIAVLEVGLGGRLDATNVVQPLVSVITDIALDHTEWLGPTIRDIAREKAGILRAKGVLVTLPQHPEANQSIGEAATALHVRGVSATPYMPPIHTAAGQPYTLAVLGSEIEIASPLHGAHQHRNIALAIATAVELAEQQKPGTASATTDIDAAPAGITPASIAAGIRNTRWPGRLELLTTHSGPAATQWILDVAHNPAGAWALRAGLNDGTGLSHKCLIFSCLQDKPLSELAQILFPLFDQVIFAPIQSPRAAAIPDLLAAAAATGTPARAFPMLDAALDEAARISAGGPVVISGSVYLVGAARSLLRSGF